MGSVIEQHPSPQSSPEVNVTNNLKSDLEEHVGSGMSGSQVVAVVTPGGGVEEDVDVPEPDEAEVHLYRSNVINNSNVIPTDSEYTGEMTRFLL